MKKKSDNTPKRNVLSAHDLKGKKKPLTGNEKKALPEISSVELDNIFFPEEKPDPYMEFGQNKSLRDLEDITTEPTPELLQKRRKEKQPGFHRKKQQSISIEETLPKIRIEEATPLPPAIDSSVIKIPSGSQIKINAVSKPVVPDFRAKHIRSHARMRPKSRLHPVKKQENVPPQKIKPKAVPSKIARPEQKIISPHTKRPILDQSRADVTKIFFPANRLDKKGNVMPLPPEKLYEDDSVIRKKELKYTIMLAFGQKIRFRRVINICSDFLGTSPQTAERRIRFGKGILFEHLDKKSTMELKNQFDYINQKITIVKENKTSNIPDAREIDLWLFSRRHFQVQTDKERIVLPWDEVCLLSAGSIRLLHTGTSFKKTLDFIVREPFVRLRLWDTTFNYKASGITYDSMGDKNFISLIKVIKRFTKKARISPTLKEMLEKKLPEPKHFTSLEEFDNYTKWQYLSFFGEPLI
jgi:hypothetical protein